MSFFERMTGSGAERNEVPIGNPRGLDFVTGKVPANQKLAELEKQDQAIDSMSDPDAIEDAVEELVKRLRKNPNDADAQNQVARLRAKLDGIHKDSTH